MMRAIDRLLERVELAPAGRFLAIVACVVIAALVAYGASQ